MDKLLNSIPQNWVNQSIGLLFFICGIILGVIAVSVIWKKFTLRDKKKESVEKTDVSSLIERAKMEYKDADTEINLEKLGYFCKAITDLLEEIPPIYGATKLHDVLAKEEVDIKGNRFLVSDVRLYLDFTVYELLYFVRAIAENMRKEVEKLLNSFEGKAISTVGKFVGKKTLQENVKKDLDEITVEALFRTVKQLLKKKEPENKTKSFFGEVIDKAKNFAFNKVAMPIVNPLIDKYVIDVIQIFAEEINNLYSKEYKRLKDISIKPVIKGES